MKDLFKFLSAHLVDLWLLAVFVWINVFLTIATIRSRHVDHRDQEIERLKQELQFCRSFLPVSTTAQTPVSATTKTPVEGQAHVR